MIHNSKKHLLPGKSNPGSRCLYLLLCSKYTPDLPEMFARRAPGNTCLSALAKGGNGTMENPINQSKFILHQARLFKYSSARINTPLEVQVYALSRKPSPVTAL